MTDGGRTAQGRLLAFALMCPLVISAVAAALVICQLCHPSSVSAFLGAYPEFAAAVLTLLVAVGAVASLYARAQVMRVSQGHARALDLAREALGAREEFLTVASHELKTPLTSLRLQLGSALRILRLSRDPAAESISARLEVADRQAGRLAQIVDGLIDSSRAAEPINVVLDEVDLVALTRDVVMHLRETLARAGCEAVLRLPSGAVWGEWDAACLRQALSHLISNAAKYGRGHPIEIQLSFDENAAHLSVRDQGIGIDPRQHERIFGRFERAVSPRNYGGLGLGLWVARRAVSALGGTIRVESRQGDGSTFTIELPLPVPRLSPSTTQIGWA